jgi:hypothetical protein
MMQLGMEEFAMHRFCNLTIGRVGFFWRFEIPDMDLFVIAMYNRSPHRAFFGNTFESRFIVWLKSFIPLILRCGTNAKIAAKIIESIAIDMVNRLTRQCSNNQAMKRYFPSRSSRVGGSDSSVIAPTVFGCPLKHIFIYKASRAIGKFKLTDSHKFNCIRKEA